MAQRGKPINYIEQDSDESCYFITGDTSSDVSNRISWRETVSQELTYRLAVEKDSKKASELIHLAIDDISEQLTGETNTDNIRETLGYFFHKKNNRLSFQNTIIADILDEVVGIIISYPGDDAHFLDEPILSELRKKRPDQDITFDKEADPGDYYIDTICVSPKFQGYGIGTVLMKEVEKRAKQIGYTRVSLNVAFDNPSAKELYKKIGFIEEKVIQINGHDYDYMVKILEG